MRSFPYLSQAEKYLVSLDPVLQRLTNDIPQAGYDRRSLAQLVLHLQQFMEIALGINVSHAPKIAPPLKYEFLSNSDVCAIQKLCMGSLEVPFHGTQS